MAKVGLQIGDIQHIIHKYTKWSNSTFVQKKEMVCELMIISKYFIKTKWSNQPSFRRKKWFVNWWYSAHNSQIHKMD